MNATNLSFQQSDPLSAGISNLASATSTPGLATGTGTSTLTGLTGDANIFRQVYNNAIEPLRRLTTNFREMVVNTFKRLGSYLFPATTTQRARDGRMVG